ncbi:TraR/DksA family transcriptional regulator [Halospina denitrificans]|uniref:TraR/DksA family transcriptional regulator n=1 Tax=Halospina denitrificans TaxID=332522 RepID=A0A4R7JQB4_9GAMM|nr:TraR/DksA C4-type zinc finger protein [Halospina denitrificans]TDT40372.1 TraR/DksA family transcriptional regulator [Halospina denitrificans]
MSDELDLAAWRQKLLDLKEELLALEREKDDASDTVELDQQRMGRLSRMDALQGQQMAQASERRRKEMLTRIEGALRRIENGDYGACFVCGEDIDTARLNIDPTATRCIDCVNA